MSARGAGAAASHSRRTPPLITHALVRSPQRSYSAPRSEQLAALEARQAEERLAAGLAGPAPQGHPSAAAPLADADAPSGTGGSYYMDSELTSLPALEAALEARQTAERDALRALFRERLAAIVIAAE